MSTYTPIEAAEILGISIRAVQKRCKMQKVWRKNNRYVISDEILDSWRNDIKGKVPQNLRNHEETLFKEMLSKELSQKDAIISDLRAKLKEFEISSNERIEVFTIAEYE